MSVDGEGRWDWEWWGNIRGMGVCEGWAQFEETVGGGWGRFVEAWYGQGWGRFVEVEVGMVRASGKGVR